MVVTKHIPILTDLQQTGKSADFMHIGQVDGNLRENGSAQIPYTVGFGFNLCQPERHNKCSCLRGR
jgi:hypothetical protein